MNKKTTLGNMLAAAAEIYNRDLTTATLEVFRMLLDEFTAEQVQAGFNKHFRESKFFPKPAEIIQNIRGTGEGDLEARAIDQASAIWNAIARVGHGKTVKIKDPTTAAVIQYVYGGWNKLCTEMLEDQEVWFRRDFERYYKSMARTGQEYHKPLLGWFDQDNQANGYDIRLKPVEIGGAALDAPQAPELPGPAGGGHE